MATSTIPKYLGRYAEKEIHDLPPALREDKYSLNFECTLIIPVFREHPDFIQRLTNSLLSRHSCLLIVIVNQADNLPDVDSTNALLWNQLIHAGKQSNLNTPGEPYRNQHGDMVLVDLDNGSALLAVDRFSHQRTIPAQQGVGMARKIGADIALSLIATQQIRRPWIWTTDADAVLPKDYFSAIPADTQSKHAACIYPFRHTGENNKVSLATRLYEHSLNYYVEGLRWAGSPYAFHTLGSTVAISSEHYAQVRGFPKRAAAEDFYLLNKLAKTGAIKSLTSSAIEIESRQSDRVPFGTGPAVGKLMALAELSEASLFYHPEIFAQLKTWLHTLPKLFDCTLEELTLKESTLETLLEMNIKTAIEHAKTQSHSETAFSRHMNIWFDGFRTLKFIHILRDKGYNNITLDSAKNTELFNLESL